MTRTLTIFAAVAALAVSAGTASAATLDHGSRPRPHATR